MYRTMPISWIMRVTIGVYEPCVRAHSADTVKSAAGITRGDGYLGGRPAGLRHSDVTLSSSISGRLRDPSC